MDTEQIEKIKGEMSPEDFEAWRWAGSKLKDEQCRCNREVPYRESQGDGKWVDELEAIYKADGLEMPTMYVAWNPRCPVHGFPSDSEEYQKSTLAEGLSEKWPQDADHLHSKWYQRWRELMEKEAQPKVEG